MPVARPHTGPNSVVRARASTTLARKKTGPLTQVTQLSRITARHAVELGDHVLCGAVSVVEAAGEQRDARLHEPLQRAQRRVSVGDRQANRRFEASQLSAGVAVVEVVQRREQLRADRCVFCDARRCGRRLRGGGRRRRSGRNSRALHTTTTRRLGSHSVVGRFFRDDAKVGVRRLGDRLTAEVVVLLRHGEGTGRRKDSRDTQEPSRSFHFGASTFVSPAFKRLILYCACLPLKCTMPAIPIDSLPSSMTQRTESIGPGLMYRLST